MIKFFFFDFTNKDIIILKVKLIKPQILVLFILVSLSSVTYSVLLLGLCRVQQALGKMLMQS